MASAPAPAGSILRARRHPATEIVLLLCALLLVFGIPSPLVPLLVLAMTIVVALRSQRLGTARWALGVAAVSVPTLLVLIGVQGLFYPGEDLRVLAELGPARLSVEGLSVALQIWLRVSALVALSLLFGLGADAARLFDGLRTLRVPASAAYVCAAASSLIPIIGDRTAQVIAARAARGWDTGRWSVRLRLLPDIVTGLATGVLVEAEQRHEVLEQRGLGRSDHRVSLQDHHDGAAERALRRLAPVIAVALVAASAAGLLPLPGIELLIGGA